MINLNKRLLLSFALIVICWGIVVYILFITFMPYNPLTPSKQFKINVSLFVVEGWAFFTRDAREPNALIFQKNAKGELKALEIQRNNSIKNYFGWNRNSRSISVELGGILKEVDTVNLSTSKLPIALRYDSLPAIDVLNTSVNPKLKDTLLLVIEEKVPWAWIKSYNDINMPSKSIKLNVIITD